jgi:hypothetical protein
LRNDDLSLAGVAFAAGLAVLAVAGDHAAARSARTESSVEFVQSRIAGEPIMAIVSLRDQRVTIYDATGWTKFDGVADASALDEGRKLGLFEDMVEDVGDTGGANF